MTAIKQVSITSPRHLSRIKDYLSFDREKALDHDSLNLVDEHNWWREMDNTREAYGHNRPGKAGARCTYMQHQILGFNPDECDLNGGSMTKERCMQYARDYVTARYPNQEAVWVLHKEHSKGDGRDRYAVHIGLNRTNLETGRRLDEGRARQASAARVKTVRELDEKYGLRQLERGANSRSHARQPSRAEREWKRRDSSHESENDRARKTIARRTQEVANLPDSVNKPKELAKRLERDGIKMTFSRTGEIQFQYASESLQKSGRGKTRKINGSTLGAIRSKASGRVIRFTKRGLTRAFKMLAREMIRALEDPYDDGRRR